MNIFARNESLDRCDILLGFHTRAVEGIDDAEIRNDHICHAAIRMADVGMADAAIALLAHLDDPFYDCMGWIEVGQGLARVHHSEAIPILANAGERLDRTNTIDSGIRLEFAAELALGNALIGQPRHAGQRIDEVLACLADEPSPDQRIDVAALVMQAAHLTNHAEALMFSLDTALSSIEEDFGTAGAHCITVLATALRAIGRQSDASSLVNSVAHRLVSRIGADHSPLITAMTLMELATAAAEDGDVGNACMVAGIALELRHHPDVWIPSDFDLAGSYLRFTEFFDHCAVAWARKGRGNHANAIEAMDYADHITDKVFLSGDYVNFRDVIRRRLLKFETLLAIGHIGLAKTQLNHAESAFYGLWEKSCKRGKDIESELYELPEVAAGWVKLSRACA